MRIDGGMSTVRFMEPSGTFANLLWVGRIYRVGLSLPFPPLSLEQFQQKWEPVLHPELRLNKEI